MPIQVKAFTIHLTLSITIFTAAFLLSAAWWYPEFYYSANDVWKAVRTVALVDVVLGPVLTLVLYKPGKPGLWFDMAMVVVLQLSALTWGIWVLWSQRPLLTVFDQGVFYCLNSAQMETAQANPAQFQNTGRIPQVFLPPPTTPEEVAERTQLLENLPASVPPVDAYALGPYFRPVGPEAVPVMLKEELSIDEVFVQQYFNKHEQKHWQAFQKKHAERLQEYAYFLLSCSPEEHLAAVDKRSGAIVDAVRLPVLLAKKKRLHAPGPDKPPS